MKTLEFIFYLGIILIVFRFIWWIFFLVTSLFKGTNKKSKFEDYVLKLIAYFLICSLSARYVSEFSLNEPEISYYLYGTLSGFILLMYFVRKLQKRQMMARLSKNFGMPLSNVNEEPDSKLEYFVIILSMSYFIACLIWNYIALNPISNWFYQTINDFYHVPIIGWVVKLLGIFFLLGVIFRGISAISSILSGKKPQESFETYSSFNTYQSNSNDFDDYEEVDDNDDEKENE